MTAASTTETAPKTWEETHQPYAEAWLEREGVPPWSPHGEHHSAVHILLQVPHWRDMGRLLGEPEREPDSWAEIDAHEILFTYLVYGGAAGQDARTLVRLIGSFADYLGEAGVIPPFEHAAIQAEWAAWSERLLDVWETGCWYERDGTRISPEALLRRNQAAMEPRVKSKPSGSRFGRFRRRTRSARR